MMSSTLLVRVGEPADLGRPVKPRKGVASLVCERLGETVIFAHSDVPGIWSCVGKGRFRRLVYRSGGTVMEFDRIERFGRPVVSVVMAEEGLEAPYAFEDLPPEEVARIERLAGEGEKQNAFPALAERAQTVFSGSSAPFEADGYGVLGPDEWLDRVLPSDSDLRAAALERYENRCAITGLPLAMAGDCREGFVVPVHFRGAAPRAVCEVLPVTGTLAFCYAHGLVAATDGLALWLHPLLPPEIATLLRELNPAQRLNLPKAPGDWPRPDLLRRHLAEAQA